MLAPGLPGFIHVLRSWRLLAIEVVPIIAGESEGFGFKQLLHVSDPLLQAFEEALENHAPRTGIPSFLRQVIQERPIFLKLLKVGLQEMQVKVVERLEVAIEEPA